ncbi:MAG: hypothetical protein Q4D38_13905 [Planctomycetia bacterium]|nr:hypothetical protein [Planctomycetia bacterium]
MYSFNDFSGCEEFFVVCFIAALDTYRALEFLFFATICEPLEPRCIRENMITKTS